jgi:hypothetical protein
MSISLYSSATVDSLLSPKVSISSLSNGATANLDPTAPTTGQALTFDGSNLIWATVGGGGGSYLPLAGGAMDTNAVITIASSTTDARYGSDFIGLNLTGSSGSTGATFDYAGISIFDGANNINISSTQYLVQDATLSTAITPSVVTMNDGSSSLSVSSTGINFPDSTTQSTAAVPFNGGTVGSPITVTGSGGSVSLGDSVGLDLSGSTAGAGVKFADSTVQTTAAVVLTSDLAQANAIAALIGNTPYYYNTASLQTNGPSKIMTNLGSSWGLYEPAGTGYQSYSYASGNTLYFSGSFGGSGVFYVQVNGTNSTFSI